jgi:hypothetical protein
MPANYIEYLCHRTLLHFATSTFLVRCLTGIPITFVLEQVQIGIGRNTVYPSCSDCCDFGAMPAAAAYVSIYHEGVFPTELSCTSYVSFIKWLVVTDEICLHCSTYSGEILSLLAELIGSSSCQRKPTGWLMSNSSSITYVVVSLPPELSAA